MSKWHKGIVAGNHAWNNRLKSLSIETAPIQFEAGQFVRIGLEIEGEIIARPYSLVNTPHETPLEIFFNIVPEGPLTPKLFELKKGDEVLVATNPSGFLTISEVPKAKHLWMVATGTGIGPFLAMLKGTPVWQGFERIILCYSVRSPDELAYTDLIASIAQKHHPQICFIPLVTRADHPNALRMRVTDALSSGDLEIRAGVTLNAENSQVMMCGSTDMIQDFSLLLEARGMRKHRRRDPGHYTTEKYH